MFRVRLAVARGVGHAERTPTGEGTVAQTSPEHSRLRTISLILAAGVFALPFAIGRIAELLYKSINPDNVDITHGLAYLRPLLIIGAIAFVIMLALTVSVIVRLRKREGAAAVRPAWIVIATQVILVLLIWAVSGAIEAVESSYSEG